MANYDEMMAREAAEQQKQNQQAGSATLYTATDTNPDAEAGLLKLSKRTGIPAEALRLDTARKDAERQANANKFKQLEQYAPATASWVSNLDNARLAHDDTESLSTLEKGLGSLGAPTKPVVTSAEYANIIKKVGEDYPDADAATRKRIADSQITRVDDSAGGWRASTGPAPSFGSVVSGLGTSFMEAGRRVRSGIQAEVADIFGFKSLAETASRDYTRSQFRQSLSDPAFESRTAQGLYGGASSTLQQIPGIAASIVTRNPSFALGAAGAQVQTDAYAKYRARGATPGQALLGSGLEGATEIGTEMIPMGFLVDKFGKTGAKEFLAGMLLREMPTEQVATFVQDAVDTAIANPDKTWAQFGSERLDAAYQTALAVLVQSGTLGGAGHLAQRAARRHEDIAQAQTDAKTISDLMAEAGKNKLRARSTETFAKYIQHVEELGGKAPTELFIDAKDFQAALHQEGVDQVNIIAAMPSVAKQLDEALATGQDLVVPISELLTAVSGTPMEQALIPHVRTSADAMSLAESQDAQANQAEYFQQEADRILKEQADNQALQAKSDAVYEDVLAQLNAAGRFTTDVNQAYAEFMRDFVVITASRLGQDVNAVYEQYKPTIGAQLPGANALAAEGLQQGGEAERAQARVLRKRADRTTDEAKAAALRAQADALDAKATEAEAYAATQPEATGQPSTTDTTHRAPGAHNGTSIDQYSGPLEGDGLPSDVESIAALQAAKGNPDALVTVYRAAPEGSTLRAGDWVSPSRQYAEDHGEATLGAGNFQTIEQQVPARELYTDGNSVNELGYRPQLNQSAQSYTADTIEVDGVTRPTANSKGQQIAQTEEGLRNFWRWFSPSPTQLLNGLSVSEVSSLKGNTEALADFIESQSKLPESDRFFVIPSSVFAHVAGAVNNGKILDTVVRSLPVDVVNFLSGKERSAKEVLHDEAMLKDVLSIGPASNVSLGVNPSSIAELLVRVVANAGAKISGLTSGPLERNSATLANASDPVLGAHVRNSSSRDLGIIAGFGDSKVVDAEGRPLVVYHGTEGDFAEFSKDKQGTQTAGHQGGFFFAKDPALSDRYAKREGANVMPAYVRVTNPASSYDEFVRDQSFDGFINSKMVVVRNSEQIKSSVGNNGAFDPANPNILAQNPKAPRAAFVPDTLTITLLDTADLTSFLHESAHYFLTVYEQIASQPNAPEAIQQDMETLLKWMGVQPAENQTRLDAWNAMTLEEKRNGHEQFAESFEQWLFGGKAPSLEMQSLFERFRSWMLRTYKSLQQFVATHRGAKINPEVEQVFGRMLATDEQIKAAEQFRSMQPLFSTPEAAGMTAEQFAEYQNQGRDATETSNQILARRGLRDMQWLSNAKSKALKALQKEADAARAEIRQQVAQEVMSQPVYQVWQFLTGKKSEDGSTGKLLRSEVVERYGAGSPIVQRLEANKMLTNSGLPSDVVAESFGYSSGDEMMQAIANATPPKDVIEAITDQRMLEQHGEMATPDALERAAEAAIHNDARAKFLATEYAAITKQMGSVNQVRKAAKQYAESIVARTRLLDMKPNRYTVAEARAARAAAEAMRKGERDKVVTEKRNQILNNATAKAMHEARDEAKQIAEYLKTFEKESKRKGLDADYIDQIDALLEKYDLRASTSGKDIQRRESLRTWVLRQFKNGDIPDIAETLLSPQERARYLAEVQSRDADGELIYADDEERIKLLADAIDRSATRSYKELTMEELRGLYDTVRQIEHLGKLKHTLLTAVDKANYEAARDAIADSIIGNAKNSGKNTRTPNDWLGKKLAGIRQFGAAHIKAATWARIMDGGKDNGAVWKYLIRPANERATMETTMRAEATQALDAILRPVMAKVPMADKVGKGKYFPTIGESLNWQERFALALNTGNEGNLQRLLDGRGWTMQQIMPVLNSLSAQEWKAVQAVWDHFETYRPQIAEKERRVTGKEPQWIEPREMTVRTADGEELTLRGGYYPVVYDPRVNMKAQQHTAAEEAKGLMKAAYSAATTRRSFTKERAESVKGRPLLLNMQGLYSGVNDVIHDLAWHEWVLDANKLLRSKTIDQSVREHYGPEVKRELEKWRDDIVAGTRRLDHGIEQAAAWARQGVSASGLAFNVVSAAMQPLGLTQSIVRVGPQWVGMGLKKYVAAPIATTKEVNEKSEWMQNRARTRFRELNELRNQVQGQTAFKEWLGRYGYFFMMRMQQMVDVPTWWGAYEKATAQGFDEDTAVSIADQAVKDSQGGGEEVDQSGIERGGPLIKLFTVFYSFMNTAANLGYADTKTQQSKARLAVNLLLLYTVPAVLGSILRDAITPGDAGDDDEEKLLKKMLSDQLSYLAGLVAFGREFDQVQKTLTGQDKGQGYSGPAGLRVIPDSVKLAKQVEQGVFDDAFRKAFINLVGDLFGLPAAQINRSITGAQALSEGKTSNPAALVMGYQEKK